MLIGDWSSDVCSSYLVLVATRRIGRLAPISAAARIDDHSRWRFDTPINSLDDARDVGEAHLAGPYRLVPAIGEPQPFLVIEQPFEPRDAFELKFARAFRSEEHTSELQSLMRNSYAVFC